MIDLSDGVPGVNAPDPESYEEFWPYYVSQHLHPTTRQVHVTGTVLGVVLATIGVLTGRRWMLALSPVTGYGFAFTSHFVWEGNKPATFGNPLWSFRADFRQVRRFFTGELSDDVRDVRRALGLEDGHTTIAEAVEAGSGPASRAA